MIVMGGKLRRAALTGLAVAAGLFAFDALFSDGRPLGLRIVCDGSGAMEPTFRPGECVLTAPVLREFRRGDVVAYRRDDRAPSRLGRIVVLSGNGVTLGDGVFSTTGQRFDRGADTGYRKKVSRLEPVEGLPPQDALTRWLQSNSAMKREIWPDGVEYLVYFRDGGESWTRHAFDAPLGPNAIAVAPDNRDGPAPDIIGESAVTGIPVAIVWTPDKARLFSRPR